MKGIRQKIISNKLKEELKIKNGVVEVNEVSCDGCGDCIKTCPQQAIEMITLSNKQVRKMPFKGRLKVKIKGRNKAYINSGLCSSCGLCMKQCHEFAIHKVKK